MAKRRMSAKQKKQAAKFKRAAKKCKGSSNFRACMKKELKKR